MQLISKYNKEIRFSLCAIEYVWVFALKDKTGISILDSSKRKPNKVGVDQGSEFYDSSFKKWLKDND